MIYYLLGLVIMSGVMPLLANTNAIAVPTMVNVGIARDRGDLVG